ncbi:crotonobetainyl-CoA:carnitine CoA-transferase CaiB-like acyl-CoA transferase [Nocardioides ginsengisegetis]|uniref:Crotonobetainyl-CoA:carnitine CoA-transferase CaiB-like acyl-CoA transferase n=1 Tax=Nocardioides ginsengisegetis TaxID=661491 RepID=A0A7W3J2C9_9ACTN|nr:CoA transferase [Nocardioides ginsengisegetis]MBA8804952.1 crotonobetainyl-CoA:carnitine CoA-transferase CaiB-like acyl-CoA transferase [Nocardioides ginsengisegetis]
MTETVVNDVLAGIKVLEVAAWTFVPAAGAVLAEWGAEVVKVEPRDGGDPQRGLVSSGLIPSGPGGVNYIIEVPNRGKKSIGIDLSTTGGREVLYELAKTADVFLTNYLPSARAKLGIDLADLRRANPDIIYVRGSAHGPKGEDADSPGYDGVSYWSRGGIAYALSGADAEPVGARPAFGDVMGGLTIAGGVAAALFKRQRTGETSVIDVSLLGLAAWNLGPDVTSARIFGRNPEPTKDRRKMPNPLVGNYRTADGRWITLMMLQQARYWPEVLTLLGLEELLGDPELADDIGRYKKRGEVIDRIDEAFASRPLAEWVKILKPLSGAWSVLQTPIELHDDSAVIANGYITLVTTQNGTEFGMPVNPVQFDEVQVRATGAPEHGQHTEELLLEAGVEWDDIERYKKDGSIL